MTGVLKEEKRTQGQTHIGRKPREDGSRDKSHVAIVKECQELSEARRGKGSFFPRDFIRNITPTTP